MGVTVSKVSTGGEPVVAPYKVFTGLLTQSGGDNPQFLINTDNGNLVIGVTYQINNYQAGDDFTNVGAPSNANGVYFIATGTTATTWNGSTELNYNTGAPVCTVLENTIGNFGWRILGNGNYFSTKDDFQLSKSYIIVGNLSWQIEDGSYFTSGFDSNVIINSFNSLNTPINSKLLDTPIEIRVYN